MNSLDELATREKMGGCDLVGQYQAGIPVFTVRVKVNLQKRQPMSVIAQFALDLIYQGIDTPREVELALGLESEFVRKALAYLDQHQLIDWASYSQESGALHFEVTQKGKQARLETMASFTPERVQVQVDGLTGSISSLDKRSLSSGDDLRKLGMWLLHPSSTARPTLESLNNEISDLIPICQTWFELEETDRVVEVLDVEKCWLMYKPANILVFRERAPTERIHLRVYEGYIPVPEYDQILTKRERRGGRVIPDDLLIPAADAAYQSQLMDQLQPQIEELVRIQERIEDVEAQKEELATEVSERAGEAKYGTPLLVTAKSARIQELETQLQELKRLLEGQRPVKAQEHRRILTEALATAKEEVIITSPWIKRGATDSEIIKLIRAAVGRGVSVKISYGMPLESGRTLEEYIHKDVAEALEKIQKTKGGENLLLKYGNTHGKVLVCDRRFCVVTSFNWLSYRGGQGFRKENGMYSEIPDFVNLVADQVLEDFEGEAIALS